MANHRPKNLLQNEILRFALEEKLKSKTESTTNLACHVISDWITAMKQLGG